MAILTRKRVVDAESWSDKDENIHLDHNVELKRGLRQTKLHRSRRRRRRKRTSSTCGSTAATTSRIRRSGTRWTRTRRGRLTLETTLLPRDRPTILDEISVSGDAATSRCPCGVRKRAGATAATRTARYSVPSATRRRQSAPRINGGLFCPGARTNLAQNFAVRVILVRITSMWAFRVLARVGPRGRRRPVTNQSFVTIGPTALPLRR